MVNVHELHQFQGARLDAGIQEVWNDYKDFYNDAVNIIRKLHARLTFQLDFFFLGKPPSTKQQCLDAARRINASLGMAMDHMKEDVAEADQVVSQCLCTLDDLSMVIAGSVDRVEDRELVKGIEKEILAASHDIGSKLKEYMQRWVKLDKTFVYQELKVAEHLQKWWKEEAMSGLHLVLKKESREGLGNVESCEFRLPAEIMSTIYSLSSLESCASLRQVNKAWYSVFQSSDAILGTKVQRRNPFLRPGDGDLNSWQDCALVFVSRLEWECCEKIDEIQVPPKEPKRYTVIGTELEFNEKLPENFVSLFGEHHLQVEHCAPIPSFNVETQQSLKLDHWTLETKEIHVPYSVVSTGDDRNIIMKNGIQISLPGHMKPPQDRSHWRVAVGRNVITIKLKNAGMLIMPRDKPEYEHGVPWFKPDGFYEAGELSTVREGSSGNHHFVDLSTSLMVLYAQAYEARPQALYNGLVWFCLDQKKALIPTFIDYQTPDKVYFKRERIITGVDVERKFEQGYRPHGTAQFLVTGSKDDDVHVIDLATGEISLIACPYGWKDPVFQLGFVNGKFSARWISEESASKYQTQMLAGK